MSITLETLEGAAVAALLPALARLRIAVFAEWPYLYAGEDDPNAGDGAGFAAAPGAALIVARDGAEVIGIASCQALSGMAGAVPAAFASRGIDAAGFCYFDESVLLPAYRGQGIGVRFFAAREAVARAQGLRAAAFCAVVRNANDPRRPLGYAPLDGFWRQRGYAPRPDISCVMRWRELGDDRATPHAMGFWLKDPL